MTDLGNVSVVCATLLRRFKRATHGIKSDNIFHSIAKPNKTSFCSYCRLYFDILPLVSCIPAVWNRIILQFAINCFLNYCFVIGHWFMTTFKEKTHHFAFILNFLNAAGKVQHVALIWFDPHTVIMTMMPVISSCCFKVISCGNHS